MALLIPSGLDDDTDFTTMLHLIVTNLVARESPEQVWVIQIDNWFGDKWLRFSGKGVVDFRFPAYMNRYDGALAEFHQDKLTFPPFSPNRVMGQWSYVRFGKEYAEAPLTPLPHNVVKRPSQANLHRRVLDFNHTACFFWFSGKTLTNGRGSLMVYSVKSQTSKSWFAGFKRAGEWSITSTKGVARSAVLELAGRV